MPSPFADIDAAIQAAMDRSFGEGIRVLPMVEGDFSRLPDPERDPVETTAIISQADKTAGPDYRANARDGAAVVLAPSEIWIERAAYIAIGYPIRRGDVIELLTGSDRERRATVAAVHAGDMGDHRIILTWQASPPAPPPDPDPDP